MLWNSNHKSLFKYTITWDIFVWYVTGYINGFKCQMSLFGEITQDVDMSF